jgi:hypothetical protein
MSKKELIEKASDPVGGGQTGVSKSADPTGGKATLAASNLGNGDPMKKIDHETPGQSEQDTDSANNTKPTADNSGSHKSSVAMKGSAAQAGQTYSFVPNSVKEEMLAMFGEDLAEDFKEKATTLFEAAVSAQVVSIRESLEGEFAAKQTELEENFQTAVTEMKTELSEQVNEYLDYVVEEWMKQNEVAIESSLRTELTEEFITKLKGLFAESYIEVPEDKVNVIDEMAASFEELEGKYNALVAEKIELEKQLEESTKDSIFADVAEGLALSQVEKFRALAEGVSYGDAQGFQKKLEIVKEQYFGQKPAQVAPISEDTPVELVEEVAPTASADPSVSRYVSAISRTVKK